MNVESQIIWHKFKPREYQLPIIEAFESGQYKKLLVVAARRMGKDFVAWNLLKRAALWRVGTYYYIFPTYASGKKILWDATTIDGVRFLDYIPKELVESINGQEMKIRLINGSLIQILGSDNPDSVVGTNPIGCVFSEYALQDPRGYALTRPILAANGGWAFFVSTPSWQKPPL
jgi:phage terminase large subunit